MVEQLRELDLDTVRANLERVRAEIARARRDPAGVEVLVAVKYVPVELMEVLAQAGVRVVGENRAQELLAKARAHPGRFTWDFIGQLQSRKVKQLLGNVRYIHSVASDSVLEQLRRHAAPETEVLVEVNVAGETGKSGVQPGHLEAFLGRCPVSVAGLMTMPPQAASAQDSRAHFTQLRKLAEEHGLRELSMGTSQDYVVALQEGATILRLGSRLLRPPT
ncbi:MAG: YggS family pyridoxal phosphate enzyme [Actinomycetota bacterium]|nr:YggS family pyridoxal phosphate enzyme [Actinomycetota bacterium]